MPSLPHIVALLRPLSSGPRQVRVPLRSKNWDARVAAGQAIDAIAANVPQWNPVPTGRFLAYTKPCFLVFVALRATYRSASRNKERGALRQRSLAHDF